MKLKDYINALNKFIEKHPESSEFEIITNKYDEIFKKLSPRPKLGYFDNYNDFITENDLNGDYDDDDEIPKLNAICV